MSIPYENGLIDNAMDMIRWELEAAVKKFGPFNSAHEGYAVIKEELDELWDEVKDKNSTGEALAEEAIQVGAMAARFLIDCILFDEYDDELRAKCEEPNENP